MRAKHIRRGFHRLGLAIAALCLVPALIMLPLGLYWFAIGDSQGPQLLMVGSGWLPAAGVSYVAFRAIGWIAAGFAGDDGPSG